ncbi:hypothetical protein DFH28DRAFT_1137115 [Melampsora americana]|nr:hypothetical protein DFH28DRAFT_1137115 [Melampsora americana]
MTVTEISLMAMTTERNHRWRLICVPRHNLHYPGQTLLRTRLTTMTVPSLKIASAHLRQLQNTLPKMHQSTNQLNACPAPRSRPKSIPKSKKTTQKRVIKKEKVTSGPTAEALALDDTTSDEEDLTQATTSATDRKRSAPRSTLSRRGLEPLPSIDPSHVHSKDHKNALASAIQQGNEARFEMINKTNALESSRIQAEQDARASDLSWAKERY